MPAGIHAYLRETCLEIKEIANAIEGVRKCDEEIMAHDDYDETEMKVVNVQMFGLMEKMKQQIRNLEEWYGAVNERG